MHLGVLNPEFEPSIPLGVNMPIQAGPELRMDLHNLFLPVSLAR
jgi:hypothetical protein